MKTYKLHVAQDDELKLLKIIRKEDYNGLYWPHSPKDGYNFELDLNEEDLLALMLQVPCRQIN
jgi:hypothetical protein